MLIGYARVSSESQSYETQISYLKKIGCEKIFSEKQSAKHSHREALAELLAYARDRDIIHVTKVDRLARNVVDALNIADKLKDKNVGLVCHDLGQVDINSDIGRVIYTTISAFAEMERKRILERCREGREIAKKDGKHLGRYKNEELHQKIVNLLDEGIPKKQIAKRLGCSRTTVYNVIKQL